MSAGWSRKTSNVFNILYYSEESEQIPTNRQKLPQTLLYVILSEE